MWTDPLRVSSPTRGSVHQPVGQFTNQRVSSPTRGSVHQPEKIETDWFKTTSSHSKNGSQPRHKSTFPVNVYNQGIKRPFLRYVSFKFYLDQLAPLSVCLPWILLGSRSSLTLIISIFASILFFLGASLSSSIFFVRRRFISLTWIVGRGRNRWTRNNFGVAAKKVGKFFVEFHIFSVIPRFSVVFLNLLIFFL